MRWGHESFVLIAVPLLLLVGAFGLLIPGGQEDEVGLRPRSVAVGETAPDHRVSRTDPRDSRRAETGLEGRAGVAADHARADAEASLATSDGTAIGTNRKKAPSRWRSESKDGGSPGEEKVSRTDGVRQRRAFRGTLTDSNGVPVPSSVVVVTERRNLFDAAGRPLQEATAPFTIPVDADGSFEVPRREGYVYVIHVHASGFATISANLYAMSSPVVVLYPAARVEGRITDRVTGLPIKEASVSLTTSAGTHTQETDAAGAYGFASVAAGQAYVEVSHSAYRPLRIGLASVPSGGVVVRDIQLDSGRTLEGVVVVGATGEPPQGWVRVRAFDRYRQLPAGDAMISSDGRFTLHSIEPGTVYGLIVESDDYGPAVAQVSVPTTGPVPTVMVSVGPAWVLDGSVVDPRGHRLPGTRLVATVDGWDAWLPPRVSYADLDGAFSLPGLGAGVAYTINAVHPEYSPAVIREVTDESYIESEFQIQLEGGGSVTGVIETAEGVAVPGALIRLRTNETMESGGQRAPIYAFSTDDGTFTILHVPAGEVEMTVFAAGFARYQTSFLLPSGGATAHHVAVLSPSAPIRVGDGER